MMSGRMRRQYVKLCDIEDFDDPAFLAAVRSILPERDPLAHIERKVWEFAMLALLMEEVGQLDEQTEALSVGAGDERILFWLADRIGKVVATDIYGEGSFAGNEAEHSMLTNPASHAPYPYREDHLEVLWMDGSRLEFDADSFDIVFTLSSIEHFGSPQVIARSAREIGRVLRPGGYAVVVTECIVRLNPLDALERVARGLGPGRRRPGVVRGGALSQVFTPRELHRLIVRPSGLRLVQPLELTLSPRAWERVTPADINEWPSPETPYPMILMGVARSVFTSVCLVLEKPRSQ
jgi:SAM-dependent methyltransferase